MPIIEINSETTNAAILRLSADFLNNLADVKDNTKDDIKNNQIQKSKCELFTEEEIKEAQDLEKNNSEENKLNAKQIFSSNFILDPTGSLSTTKNLGDDKVDASSMRLDSQGYPWDERIHAKTRALNADGTWRIKRGVNDELIQKIRGEYRGEYLSPKSNASLNSPLITFPEITTFPELMSKITKLVTQHLLTREDILKIIGTFKIPTIPAIHENAHLIPQINAKIDEFLEQNIKED